ncbi:MAG: hypothetical protein K1X36_00620 [Pyrinomonadaceae bacterium]|nr:hypothetical protein [Pyrinomonadaceae bacterium]
MNPAEASLPSDTEVLVKRSFDAGASLVWRAYMEPELMRRWCGSTPGWSMPVWDMNSLEFPPRPKGRGYSPPSAE